MKGNAIRLERAEDKRLIRAGLLDPAEVLRKPPAHWERATILELLTAMHRVGRGRARKWLFAERVDPSSELRDLTELQRFRLAKHVTAAVLRAQHAREALGDE